MHQSLNKHLANGMFTRAHRTRRMWMWMWINGWNLYIQMNTNEFYNFLKMTHIPYNTLLMLMLMLMIGGIFRSVDSGRRKKAIIQPQKWTHLLTLNFVMAISEIVFYFDPEADLTLHHDLFAFYSQWIRKICDLCAHKCTKSLNISRYSMHADWIWYFNTKKRELKSSKEIIVVFISRSTWDFLANKSTIS